MTENARGALAMALAMLCFSSNDAIMKLLFQDAPIGQAMVLRGVLGVFAALARLGRSAPWPVGVISGIGGC